MSSSTLIAVYAFSLLFERIIPGSISRRNDCFISRVRASCLASIIASWSARCSAALNRSARIVSRLSLVEAVTVGLVGDDMLVIYNALACGGRAREPRDSRLCRPSTQTAGQITCMLHQLSPRRI